MASPENIHLKLFAGERPRRSGGTHPVYGDWDIGKLCDFLEIPTSDYTVTSFKNGLVLNWSEGRALCHEKGCVVQRYQES